MTGRRGGRVPSGPAPRSELPLLSALPGTTFSTPNTTWYFYVPFRHDDRWRFSAYTATGIIDCQMTL